MTGVLIVVTSATLGARRSASVAVKEDVVASHLQENLLAGKAP